MFEGCHANSHPLSSPSLLALRLPSHRRVLQPHTDCWPSAPELFLRALSPGFFSSFLLCMGAGLSGLVLPRGSALHRFVWRLAAGWHIVPRVLIWCQLPFHLHLTPPVSLCLPVSQLVYAGHPLKQSKRIRHTASFSDVDRLGSEFLGLWERRSRLVAMLWRQGGGGC